MFLVGEQKSWKTGWSSMNGSRAGRNWGPHGVAAIASSFVVLAGVGIGAYFLGLHGAAHVPGRDLGILAAAIAAVAVAAHFAVATAVRQAGGATMRKLLGRALDVDPTDSEALVPFAAVPPLRDLVGMWIGEKHQTRELSDRLESLRGEIDGLLDGMNRSAQDLGRLRTENMSPIGVQFIGLWNVMVERIKTAEERDAGGDAGSTSGSNVAPEVRTLVARLDELESELDRLRDRVQEPIVDVGTLSAGLERSGPAVPMFAPESDEDDLLVSLDVEADDSSIESELDAVTLEPEVDDVNAASHWGEVQVVEPMPNARLWQPAADPERPLREPFQVEALQPPARRTGDPAAASPPGTMRFEDLDFPHFVGKPVRPLPERLAMTYEAQPSEDVTELPGNALLFDDDPLPPQHEIDLGGARAREDR